MGRALPGTRGSSGSGKALLPFHARVERIVKAIPRGEVLSYAKVAVLAGRPGGARAVVRALYVISGAPWWRVIRSDGTVAKEVAARQVPRLRAEGVTVRGLRVSVNRAQKATRGRRLLVRPSKKRIPGRRASVPPSKKEIRGRRGSVPPSIGGQRISVRPSKK